MPDNSKFANLFGNAAVEEMPVAGRIEKAVGRPLGKRSDSRYKQYSHLLKVANHKRASRLLEDNYEGKDFSDLVDDLLEEWIARHENKELKAA